jgi:hypothetical protein
MLVTAFDSSRARCSAYRSALTSARRELAEKMLQLMERRLDASEPISPPRARWLVGFLGNQPLPIFSEAGAVSAL